MSKVDDVDEVDEVDEVDVFDVFDVFGYTPRRTLKGPPLGSPIKPT